jgi:hypothetical protein
VFPIILLLLENRFKIAETIRKNRLERERKDREERRAGRLEGITLTAKMWNELHNLISEIRYCCRKKKGDPGLKDICRRLSDFASAGEDIVNMWHTRFALPAEDERLFIAFVNILEHSASSVAYFLERTDNKEEIEDLQNSLGSIQDGIKTAAHHGILLTLKDRITLLELQENGAPIERIKDIQSRIEGRLTELKSWAEAIKKEELMYNKILPAIEGKDVDKVRKVAEIVESWVQENPGKPMNECDKAGEVIRLIRQLPHKKLILGAHIDYTKEYVRHLADYLAIENIWRDIFFRGEWRG